MREEGIVLENALLSIDEQQLAYIEQLKSFIRIPSVSAGADAATGDGLAQAADFLVLDPDHPTLAAHRPDTLLDAWVFTNAGSALREVWIAGRRVVADGHHPREEAIHARFQAVMSELTQSL